MTANPSDKPRILVVDDDPNHAEMVAEGLERTGYQTSVATSGTEGVNLIHDREFDLVVTDLVMRDVDGMRILQEAHHKDPEIEVILLTGHGTIESAVEAMQKGAYTYLGKPTNLDALRIQVRKALEKQGLSRTNIELRRELDKKYGFGVIIGSTEEMQKIFDLLPQISQTNVTVLIEGESGTGKELVARSIHYNSPRKKNHFVPLNCAALAEGILESELFGHEKGAFTGATYQRKGRFEFAHNGTLFLDEIGDMPLSTQVKLLRVLEDGEVVRLGSNVPVKVDVRLIAATNKNLESLVAAGKFRDDLFFRLRVVYVKLPPLRQRQADITMFIDTFIKEFAGLHGKKISGLTPAARAVLARYPWPGNVRELRNCIESMVVISRTELLDADDIPDYISQHEQSGEQTIAALSGISMDQAERELIKNTLTMVKGNREQAAKMLGIGERTLYRKLKRYQLE
jgi:two-component system response regulator HydG